MNVISDNPLIKIMYSIHYNLNNTMINPYDFKNHYNNHNNDNDDDNDITSKNPNNDCDYFYEYSRNP
jgi:hypothetical protein